MPIFQYKAVAPSGEVTEGRMQAASRADVIRRLQADDFVPIRADEEAAAEDDFGASLRRVLRQPVGRTRASPRALGLFTQELATLLGAGLTAERALDILSGAAGGPSAALARGLLQRLQAGQALSEAMATRPDLFGGFYVAMVRAGEAAGDLAAALSRLAGYLERARAAADDLKSALIYPAILVAFAVLSVMLLMTFVIPQFEVMFREAGRELPAATRALIAVSGFVRDFGWLLVALLAIAWLAGRQRRAGALVDGYLLRLPYLGRLIARIETERFARALGALLSGGVALPPALDLATGVLSNRAMARAAAEVAGAVREGGRFGDAIVGAGLFPGVAAELVKVGEETGRLAEMLLRTADIEAADLAASLRRLVAVVVPGVTILLGLFVAAIILAVMTAILGAYDLTL